MNKPLVHSDTENRRFGLEVARGACAEVFSAREIIDQIFRERTDVAIVRIPESRSSHAAVFERQGVLAITADTLVYYHVDPQQTESKDLRNLELEFDPLGPSNADLSLPVSSPSSTLPGSWLKALQHYRLSYAYPFISQSIVMVTLLSVLVFGEVSGPQQWIGPSVVPVGPPVSTR